MRPKKVDACDLSASCTSSRAVETAANSKVPSHRSEEAQASEAQAPTLPPSQHQCTPEKGNCQRTPPLWHRAKANHLYNEFSPEGILCAPPTPVLDETKTLQERKPRQPSRPARVPYPFEKQPGHNSQRNVASPKHCIDRAPDLNQVQ